VSPGLSGVVGVAVGKSRDATLSEEEGDTGELALEEGFDESPAEPMVPVLAHPAAVVVTTATTAAAPKEPQRRRIIPTPP
jgi:hypothetical protein